MSIKVYVDELKQINAEIKRNNITNKNLRQRAKELENNITEYLKTKDHPGIKYNGQAIILENKEQHLTKKKKDREKDVLSLLESFGIQNPEEAYKQLENVKKGEAIEKHKLRFKQL